MTDTNIAASLTKETVEMLCETFEDWKNPASAGHILRNYRNIAALCRFWLQHHPDPSGRTQAQGEPVAWVLVPREPTPAMIEEAYKRNPMVGPPESLTEERARQHRERHERNLRANWKAMIAAAPPPAVAEQQAPSEARAVTDGAIRRAREAWFAVEDQTDIDACMRAALESFAQSIATLNTPVAPVSDSTGAKVKADAELLAKALWWHLTHGFYEGNGYPEPTIGVLVDAKRTAKRIVDATIAISETIRDLCELEPATGDDAVCVTVDQLRAAIKSFVHAGNQDGGMGGARTDGEDGETK